MMPNDGIDVQPEATPLPWESIRPEVDLVNAVEPKRSTPALSAPASRTIGKPVDVQIEPIAASRGSSFPAAAISTSPVATAQTEVDVTDEPTGPPTRGGGWTLPLLCAGICLLACCIIIPQADANRRADYEKRELQLDLAAIQKQVFVNDEFLKKVGEDPTLAERLAQRQMKIVRQGSQVIRLAGDATTASDMSPFQLTHVPRPTPLPAYKPIGGMFARLCYSPRPRLYLIGLGLMMVAGGLVLGATPTSLSPE